MATLQDIAELSFETAFRELESIVRQLEEGKATLDQTMTLYQRGVSLRQHCEKILQEARLKVEQITLGVDGQVTTTNASLEN
jgi:exodeoxyribonuclease VII small subunit